MVGYKVFSAFDGMACARLALDLAGVRVAKYYASEVEKWPIKVALDNWPNIIELGDIRNVELPEAVDIFAGGSPCQSFSFAGKRAGMAAQDGDERLEVTSLEQYLELKREGFEFVGQSYLFWEYVRLLRDAQRLNPNVLFLLENTRMEKKWRDVITRTLGVEPVLLNSALVSAQNRERYYWANWPLPTPKDRGLLLKDIIGVGEVDRAKSHCLDASYHKGTSADIYLRKHRRQAVFQTICVNPKSGRGGDDSAQPSVQDRIYSAEGKMPALTTGHHPSVAYGVPIETIDALADQFGGVIIEKLGEDLQDGAELPKGVIHVVDGWTLLKGKRYRIKLDDGYYLVRKLTPEEAEALQTLPIGYTAAAPATARYHMIGNGWTAEMIACFFRNIDLYV